MNTHQVRIQLIYKYGSNIVLKREDYKQQWWKKTLGLNTALLVSELYDILTYPMTKKTVNVPMCSPDTHIYEKQYINKYLQNKSTSTMMCEYMMSYECVEDYRM